MTTRGMMSKKRADQVSGGVFLIGLALLLMTNFFWPGILFVIGASTIARGMAEGQAWYAVPGGISMIGLGIVFWLGFSLPLLLILIGVSMLFGYSYRSRVWQGQDETTDAEEKHKHKNEELI